MKVWIWPHHDNCGKPAFYRSTEEWTPCILAPDHSYPCSPGIPNVDFDPAMWEEHLEAKAKRRMEV